MKFFKRALSFSSLSERTSFPLLASNRISNSRGRAGSSFHECRRGNFLSHIDDMRDELIRLVKRDGRATGTNRRVRRRPRSVFSRHHRVASMRVSLSLFQRPEIHRPPFFRLFSSEQCSTPYGSRAHVRRVLFFDGDRRTPRAIEASTRKWTPRETGLQTRKHL